MIVFHLILHPAVPLDDFHIFIISAPCSSSGGVFNLRKAGGGGCSLESHHLPGLLSVFISDQKETKKTVSPR